MEKANFAAVVAMGKCFSVWIHRHRSFVGFSGSVIYPSFSSAYFFVLSVFG
jgi:hypothetical protein